MELYTIGYAQMPAEEFFGLLLEYRVRTLVDIRLKPSGQLAGYAKQRDLPYFLKVIARCDYLYMPELAPTQNILESYRETDDWDEYTRQFEELMDERSIPSRLEEFVLTDGPCCLLCAEAVPARCHRRLVAERMRSRWPELEIIHLPRLRLP